MNDNRDYADLNNPEIAVYNFRGYTVLKFIKKDKSFLVGKNANMCSFIPSDYKYMSEFLMKCYQFCQGEIPDVESVGMD